MDRPLRSSLGFTLLELIGVLAIIAVLASIVAPVTLRSIEEAALRAEAQNLQSLAEHLRADVRQARQMPVDLVQSLSNYVGPTRVVNNSRDVARVYVRDPASAQSTRVLMLSCMRNDLTLPPVSAVTAARFQALWDLGDQQTVPWNNGWWAGGNAWTQGTSADVTARRRYLLIERVQLSSILSAMSVAVAVQFNNASATSASVRLTPQSGSGQLLTLTAGSTTAAATPMRSGDRIDLYRQAGGNAADLIYTYVIADAGPSQLNFQFDGIRWINN